jgi:predicted Zn-ribbon and HTH transcriptional regulator
MADALRELPALYRQLADALTPGRRGVDGRSGTRTAPIPCNAEALELRARGGIEGVVGGWARDLCERERWDVPDYQSVQAVVDWSCAILHANLGMICDEHEAVKEIADELRSVSGQARRLVTGEKPPIRIPVACEGCGHILRVSLDMDGIRCPRCQQQYDHHAMLHLTPARRAAA